MEIKQVIKETESQRQDRNKRIVDKFIYLCQSSLVDYLLGKEIFSYDDIENQYYSFKEAKEGNMINDDVKEEDYEAIDKEILEWWLCEDWFLEKLKEMGQPILENDYGTWWGRCTSGQAICLDYEIGQFRKKWGRWANRK